MEILQLALVAVAGFISVRFIYKKFFMPQTTKDCGTDCDCN